MLHSTTVLHRLLSEVDDPPPPPPPLPDDVQEPDLVTAAVTNSAGASLEVDTRPSIESGRLALLLLLICVSTNVRPMYYDTLGICLLVLKSDLIVNTMHFSL